MSFYEANKKVLAEFYASSSPSKKVSGTLEILNNGEVEICTLEPFEDKLKNIKRSPIINSISNLNLQNPDSKLNKSRETHYYRIDSFCRTYYPDLKNNKKVSKIESTNDNNIPEFDWVRGECEFGYFGFSCKYKNLIRQKDIRYSTYKGFEFGILYRDPISKRQGGFDKVRFRLDYLSLFFNEKSKLSQIAIFPTEAENTRNTTYQITHSNQKDELLSFWLEDFKVTVCSKVTNLPKGNNRFEKNQLKIDITEEYWIDVSKNKSIITKSEIFQLQNFFERYFSLCLNTPIYTHSIIGFIDNTPIDIIFRKATGEINKVNINKIILTHGLFTVRSINRFWLNRSKFATLYSYTISNLQFKNTALENLLFNFIQAIENYLNVEIKQKLFNKLIVNGKYTSIKQCLVCKKPKIPRNPTPNNPSFQEKFQEMIEQSDFLMNYFNFDTSLISQIKEIRNALAHGDGQEQNELIRKTNIPSLLFNLRKVTKYCILKTLGFSEEQVLILLTTDDK